MAHWWVVKALETTRSNPSLIIIHTFSIALFPAERAQPFRQRLSPQSHVLECRMRGSVSLHMGQRAKS